MKKRLIQAIADEHDLLMKNADEIESEYETISSDSDGYLIMIIAELKAIRYELAQLKKENKSEDKE